MIWRDQVLPLSPVAFVCLLYFGLPAGTVVLAAASSAAAARTEAKVEGDILVFGWLDRAVVLDAGAGAGAGEVEVSIVARGSFVAVEPGTDSVVVAPGI